MRIEISEIDESDGDGNELMEDNDRELIYRTLVQVRPRLTQRHVQTQEESIQTVYRPMNSTLWSVLP